MGAVKVVVLVPWRAGDELREQSWAVVRPYLEKLNWPIYEGDCDGLWSRGAAINAAAAEAGDWDVAVIADADTIPPQGLDTAVGVAHATGGGIRPHDHLYRLTPAGSVRMAWSGIAGIVPELHIDREFPGGGLLVVSRKGWDAVGGFSTDFQEWGHEDSYFNIQLLLHADWDRLPGEAYHLWHPAPARNNKSYRTNRQLLASARQVHRTQILEAEARKGWSIGRVL
jgi:hypothetical protein